MSDVLDELESQGFVGEREQRAKVKSLTKRIAKKVRIDATVSSMYNQLNVCFIVKDEENGQAIVFSSRPENVEKILDLISANYKNVFDFLWSKTEATPCYITNSKKNDISDHIEQQFMINTEEEFVTYVLCFDVIDGTFENLKLKVIDNSRFIFEV